MALFFLVYIIALLWAGTLTGERLEKWRKGSATLIDGAFLVGCFLVGYFLTVTFSVGEFGTVVIVESSTFLASLAIAL